MEIIEWNIYFLAAVFLAAAFLTGAAFLGLAATALFALGAFGLGVGLVAFFLRFWHFYITVPSLFGSLFAFGFFLPSSFSAVFLGGSCVSLAARAPTAAFFFSAAGFFAFGSFVAAADNLNEPEAPLPLVWINFPLVTALFKYFLMNGANF
ncbi:hypothetical protein CVS40_10686 [Lucilia cuprina]|nr:hypothetical protein CVS40_10686 [Lucilia cuprina]